MKILKSESEKCRDCGKLITLHEYEGLEGAWYTDHHCEFPDPSPSDAATVTGMYDHDDVN